MSKPAIPQKHIDAALRAVIREYKVFTRDVFSADKRQQTSEARMWFWFLLRIATEASWPDIGAATGHKHSSVYRSVHNAISWMRLYPTLRRRHDRIVADFNCGVNP